MTPNEQNKVPGALPIAYDDPPGRFSLQRQRNAAEVARLNQRIKELEADNQRIYRLAKGLRANKDGRIAELEAALLALYQASIDNDVNGEMLALDVAEHMLQEQLFPHIEP